MLRRLWGSVTFWAGFFAIWVVYVAKDLWASRPRSLAREMQGYIFETQIEIARLKLALIEEKEKTAAALADGASKQKLADELGAQILSMMPSKLQTP